MQGVPRGLLERLVLVSPHRGLEDRARSAGLDPPQQTGHPVRVEQVRRVVADLGAQRREVETGLAAEVPRDQGGVDTRAVGEVAGRGALVAAFGEQGAGGGQEQVPCRAAGGHQDAPAGRASATLSSASSSSRSVPPRPGRTALSRPAKARTPQPSRAATV